MDKIEKIQETQLARSEDIFTRKLLRELMDVVNPLLEPAVDKLEEFLGDDDKIVLIKKPKGSDPFVIILDTSEVLTFKTKSKPQDWNKHNIREFLEMLLSGRLKEELEKVDMEEE